MRRHVLFGVMTLVFGLVLMAAVAAALSAAPSGRGALRSLTPADRSVHLVGSGCLGLAGGSGSLVGDDVILTSGHVVDGLEELDVVLLDGSTVPARVSHVDTKLDVAVLRLGSGFAYSALELGDADAGDTGQIFVRATDGAVEAKAYTVRRRIRAQTENVGRDQVVERRSLQIEADVQRGDSGALLIDEQQRGVGLVWSTSRSFGEVGYAVRGDELAAVLNNERSNPSGPLSCPDEP